MENEEVYCIQNFYTKEIFAFDCVLDAEQASVGMGEFESYVKVDKVNILTSYEEYVEIMRARKVISTLAKLSKEEIELVFEEVIKQTKK